MIGMDEQCVKAALPDLMISLLYKPAHQSSENVILFSCKEENRKEVELFFERYFKQQFQRTRSVSPVEKNSAATLMEALEKLADLRARGLLTEAEFTQFKQRLIEKP